VARAQQAEGMAHVGMLGPNPDVTLASIGYRAFSAELQKLGFTQGKNLQLDYRRTDQGMDLAVAAARELVAAKSNVIVAIGPEISLRAALAPNSGLPIVILAFNYDPITRGYVESLARPGGNITGVFTRQPELAVKQLQLLVEAFPEKNHLGILWDDQTTEQFESAEQEAQKNRLAMKSIKLNDVHVQILCRGRRLDVLWRGHGAAFSPRRSFRCQDPARRQGIRSPRRAGKLLRAYGQLENRQSGWLHVTDFNLAPRQRGNRIGEPMSAFGTKRTSVSTQPMSAFGGKADIGRTLRNVRL
jgi:hypothetical protein